MITYFWVINDELQVVKVVYIFGDTLTVYAYVSDIDWNQD